ncbi:hypothetical protein GH714_038564 [Hevea brasiliensis]|uniref:Uncharacterized protein n=1 Tax=Hevea brasiliensis TaxID=3981 RepID=A0A6A6N7C2_HEVBR|nr:hypothetical protein GH714_038564 [Hevea brasiliensis]
MSNALSRIDTKKKVNLKLLIDKKTNKVLFAEAEKDFVDFLFILLSLPVGTVIRLLKNQKWLADTDTYHTTKAGRIVYGCLNYHHRVTNVNDLWVALLNKFNVKGFSALKGKMVEFGIDEGLELLNSLQSKAALTSVSLLRMRSRIEVLVFLVAI